MNSENVNITESATGADSSPSAGSAHPFQSGQTVKIGNNLFDELVKMGFDKREAAAFHSRWSGMRVTVLAAWSEGEQHWVTVDTCCEVPVQCCELYLPNA